MTPIFYDYTPSHELVCDPVFKKVGKRNMLIFVPASMYL